MGSLKAHNLKMIIQKVFNRGSHNLVYVLCEEGESVESAMVQLTRDGGSAARQDLLCYRDEVQTSLVIMIGSSAVLLSWSGPGVTISFRDILVT